MLSDYKKQNIYSRLGAMYFLMLEGVLVGIWASYLPVIQDKLEINDGELGTAGLVVFLGAVCGAYVAGFFLHTYGSGLCSLIGALWFAGFMPSIAAAPDLLWLCIFSFLFGCGMAFMDVSANSIGIVVEMVAGRALLSSFHACYSLSAGLSTIIGGAMVSSGLPILTVFTTIACASVVFSIIAYWSVFSAEDERVIAASHYSEISTHCEDEKIIPDAATPLITDTNTSHNMNDSNDVEEQNAHNEHTTTEWELLSNVDFVCFALIAFLSNFGETGMTSWLIIYVQRCFDLNSIASSCSIGTCLTCMAVGRFSGDRLRERFGRVLIIRTCGIMIVIGGSALVTLPSLYISHTPLSTFVLFVVYVSCACIGSGLSVLYPLGVSSAGHMPGVNAGKAVSLVSGLANAGSVLSPMMIGYASVLLGSVRLAFVMVFSVLSGVFLLSFKVPTETSKWFVK